MSSKAKKFTEWIVISLSIVIITAIASIQIYRFVVNSDWYTEKQARNSYAQMVEKVNDPNNIKYIEIKVNDNTEEFLYIYDTPVDLFDDLKIISYERIDSIEKLLAIWRSEPCVTVFFNDHTVTSFYITEEGKVYWGEFFELKCPSLLTWFNEVINEN